MLWLRDTSVVMLAVDDRRACISFELEVQPDLALEAFRHPFAYAALRGVLDVAERTGPPAEEVRDWSQTHG